MSGNKQASSLNATAQPEAWRREQEREDGTKGGVRCDALLELLSCAIQPSCYSPLARRIVYFHYMKKRFQGALLHNDSAGNLKQKNSTLIYQSLNHVIFSRGKKSDPVSSQKAYVSFHYFPCLLWPWYFGRNMHHLFYTILNLSVV